MSITLEEKARVMKEFGTKEGDTGQPRSPWPFENGCDTPEAFGLC